MVLDEREEIFEETYNWQRKEEFPTARKHENILRMQHKNSLMQLYYWLKRKEVQQNLSPDERVHLKKYVSKLFKLTILCKYY